MKAKDEDLAPLTLSPPSRGGSVSNYVWYTVTLSAVLGATPILTDTVRVMPTDRLVYLPLVLRGN